jgi:hypothetical protein
MNPAKPRSIQKRKDQCSLAATNAEVTVSGSMIADMPAHNCEKGTVMQYSLGWDLSSIPESIFASERARRVAAKRKKFGAVKLAPCTNCGRLINARQRRYPCPYHVPPPAAKDPARVKKSRDEVMLAIALAIAEVGLDGPGKWHVEKTGRRDINLSYTADEKALGETNSADQGMQGAEAYARAVWQQFGGLKILEHAGVLGTYYTGAIHWTTNGTMAFFATIPCGG